MPNFNHNYEWRHHKTRKRRRQYKVPPITRSELNIAIDSYLSSGGTITQLEPDFTEVNLKGAGSRAGHPKGKICSYTYYSKTAVS